MTLLVRFGTVLLGFNGGSYRRGGIGVGSVGVKVRDARASANIMKFDFSSSEIFIADFRNSLNL